MKFIRMSHNTNPSYAFTENELFLDILFLISFLHFLPCIFSVESFTWLENGRIPQQIKIYFNKTNNHVLRVSSHLYGKEGIRLFHWLLPEGKCTPKEFPIDIKAIDRRTLLFCLQLVQHESKWNEAFIRNWKRSPCSWENTLALV